MKRFVLFLSALFIATTAIAHTINWYVDGSVYHTTTCESGENVTPPTAPEKYGYTFKGWDSYTPIGYLESDGIDACYINTGIKPNYNTTKIEVDAVFDLATGKHDTLGTLFGCRKYPTYAVGMMDIGTSNEQSFAFGSSRLFSPNGAFIYGSRHVFVLSRDGFSIDNLFFEYSTFNDFGQSTYDMYMFAWNDDYQSSNKPKARSYAPAKIYYFKIYDNDVLVRDFIPVLDKYGTPCMYDKVERKFYYNAGTGDFIAGPIIGE